jgi:8-oxo-dGTP pyrophosphatase MutT (NUDIX family)
MLLFYAARSPDDVAAAADRGLSAPDGDPLVLHPSLDALPAPSDGPILVVDAEALAPRLRRAAPSRVEARSVPAEAVRNAAPYRPPRAVTAGGGYVARPLENAGEADRAGEAAVALLLIHRRGVWDLPKGTLEPDETVEECALREVREEVGVEQLRLRRGLGTTQHGYPDGDAYAVKTTHWYLMQTPERSFAPDRREGIRRVAWARWAVARRHIGYDTLRTHMDRVAADVQAAVGGADATNGTRDRP